jgi:hypothetical protein
VFADLVRALGERSQLYLLEVFGRQQSTQLLLRRRAAFVRRQVYRRGLARRAM